MKRAWYLLRTGGARDYLNLLHAPYTAVVLAYVALGFGLSPKVHIDRLPWILLAYVLGLGFGAHYLDEAADRPFKTSIPRAALYLVAATSLAIATWIGTYFAIVLNPWLLIFVIMEGLFAIGYSLQPLSRVFHNDISFSIGWGALPFITGHFFNSLSITPASILMAGGTGASAGAVISLSKWVKRQRGSVEGDLLQQSVALPERALKLLVFMMPLLASALLTMRLGS